MSFDIGFILNTIIAVLEEFSAGYFSPETITLINEYQYNIITGLILFSSDATVQIVGMLIGLNVFSPYIIIYTIFVMLIVDTISYFIAFSIQHLKFVNNFFYSKKWFVKLTNKFDTYHKEYRVLETFLLFIIKLLPFSRLLVIFFILYTKWSFKKFFLINSCVMLVWISIFGSVGYLIGNGVLHITEGKNIFSIVLIIVASLAIIFFLIPFIQNIILKRIKNQN